MLGTGIASSVTLGQLPTSPSFNVVFVKRQASITEAFFATTLVLNGICTREPSSSVSKPTSLLPFVSFDRLSSLEWPEVVDST